MALLSAIVAYLPRGKAAKAEDDVLLKQVKASSRLGPKVSAWIEKNQTALIKNSAIQRWLNRRRGPVVGKEEEVPARRQPAKRKAEETPPTEMEQAKVSCFDPQTLPASKFGEMDRQLADQQKALNNMSVQDYLQRRADFENPAIQSRDRAIAESARSEKLEELSAEFEDSLRDDGYSPGEAKSLAAAKAKSQMAAINALHNPDLAAGGSDTIAGFGDKDVNQTIGRNWKLARKGEQSIIDQMDDAAKGVPPSDRAATKMNVKLERCK